MSSPLQLGDILAIANLAKKLFEYGWERRCSSSRKYNEFGQDVDALRYNLDILSAVIQGANSQLQARSRTAALRWDPRSLEQIIGDCWATIQDCQELLSDNSSYAVDAGPLRNISWNLMVQDDVDALQFRIRQHTAKIQLALAPFEIDLLTSIQRSIDDMNASMQQYFREARRDMQDVRRDVHEVLRLQGVIVPELQQALDRQEAQTPLLVVPATIRDKLDDIYDRTTPRSPSLTDLADAFVTYFNESTKDFKPASRIARDKVPPDKAYLNLMKCIWLLEKVKDTEEFRNVPEESHWTSYVAELEKLLSDECRRFEGDLVTPAQPTLSDEYLKIWRKENRSTTVIIPREAEVVLSTRISQRSGDGEQQEQRLQLLRYLDEVHGQEFTINIYGENEENPLVDSLDFNLRTAVLIPRYVVGDLGTGIQRMPEPPRPRGLLPSRTFRGVENDRPPSTLSQQSQGTSSYRVTLGRGRRFETFNFKRLKDAMAFQHAITGYYVQGPKSFTAHATFVFSNQGSHRYKAYVQVWYPMRKEADLSATADLSSGSPTPTERANGFQLSSSPRSSTTAFNHHMRGRTPTDFRNPFGETRRDTRDTIRTASDRRPSRQTSLNTISTTDISRSPTGLGAFNLGRVSEQYTNSDNIVPPRTPHDGYGGFEERRMSLSQRSQESSRRTSIFSTLRSRTRSSVTSHWTEHSSGGSSSGSNSTIGVDTGGGITGTLHTPPPKPTIVILLDDQDTGERSIVTLDLPTSEVRPDLCDCRRSDEKGRRCRDVCFELNRQGAGGSRRAFLQARVLKPAPSTAASADWDLSRLAYTRRNDESVNSSPLENLNRVTISFDSALDRKTFSGDLFCGCVNRGKAGLETDRQRRDCVKEGHRGIVGQAKEYYWMELRAYESAEASRTHVVNGPRPND